MYLADAHIITTDLEFKMSTLTPAADVVNFAPADRIMAFADQAAIAVRGHTLIWNDDLPAWIKTLSTAEVTRLLDTHITRVMSRYHGRIHSWDVVNEPIAPWESTPGKLRSGPFYAALGQGYIERSFRLARALDPKARLVLNEQSTERYDDYGRDFRDNFATLVDTLLAAGVPIDAIGLQCHLMPSKPLDLDAYARYIERFTQAGLEVHITELDVDDRGLPGSIRERDVAIASLYRRFLSAVLANPRVTQVVTWQLGDRHSGYHYQAIEKNGGIAPARLPRPLLYDALYRKKLAWRAVASAFAGMPQRALTAADQKRR